MLPSKKNIGCTGYLKWGFCKPITFGILFPLLVNINKILNTERVTPTNQNNVCFIFHLKKISVNLRYISILLLIKFFLFPCLLFYFKVGALIKSKVTRDVYGCVKKPL